MFKITFKQENYDEEYWKTRSVLEQKHNILASQFCKIANLQQDDLVLDYGCGTGQYIHSLRELNIDAVGYEPSKVAVSNAYGLAKDRIDNKINPKEYRPFKAITCLDVMEHLSKPEIDYTIGLIHTLLETNGYAIFCICFDGDPNFDLDPTHITCRPQWWWEDLMVMKGFELVDVPKDLIYGHQFIICKKVIQ